MALKQHRPTSSLFYIRLMIISCISLRRVDCQEPEFPVVTDPFPPSSEIGPEPPATPPPTGTGECSAICQERMDQATSSIALLQQQLYDMNSTLTLRIIQLENNMSDLTLVKIPSIDNYLSGNLTNWQQKTGNDILSNRQSLEDDIAALRTQVNNMPSGGGGGDSSGGGSGDLKPIDVYTNVTTRINTLENGKIANLVYDNNLWRQNFKVVNQTFAKLRKSSTSNNVILTG